MTYSPGHGELTIAVVAPEDPKHQVSRDHILSPIPNPKRRVTNRKANHFSMAASIVSFLTRLFSLTQEPTGQEPIHQKHNYLAKHQFTVETLLILPILIQRSNRTNKTKRRKGKKEAGKELWALSRQDASTVLPAIQTPPPGLCRKR